MPFKANQDRRHHIPKQRHRVTNWAADDVALRQRGSLTVWFTEAAIAAWKAEPRATRGGQPRYSALAITTALTLRTVFRLALRQTEGLIGFVSGGAVRPGRIVAHSRPSEIHGPWRRPRNDIKQPLGNQGARHFHMVQHFHPNRGRPPLNVAGRPGRRGAELPAPARRDLGWIWPDSPLEG